MMRDKGIRVVESFLCAGSSALLISIPLLYPDYWYVYLFALIPFLWRAIKVNLFESVILGGLLAASYCFVTFPLEAWTTSGGFVFKLLGLVVLFALYGAVVNRIKQHIGFNVVFIAALWLPLEYVLSRYAGFGDLSAVSTHGSSFLLRIGSLFGLLMISFLIVLVNTLILIILKRLVQALSACCSALSLKDAKRRYPSFKEILFERQWFFFPDVRDPPLSSRTV